MGYILFLDREVHTYSTSTARRGGVLSRYGLEVTALALLRKGDSGDLGFYIRGVFGGFSSFGMYNTSVKLQIMVKGELFPLLSQELSFLQLQLLYFQEIVVADDQSIVSL